MAPKTQGTRYPVNLSESLKAIIGLCLVCASAFVPYQVLAASASEPQSLPDLTSFSSSIQNGDRKILRGAYVDGLFALPVLQQPTSNPGYISTVDNTLTQFGMVTQYGNVGLLAHNYLSGEYFSQLTPGMRIELVYGDGRIETFQVSRVYRFRAINPTSATSDFIDLDTQATITASALFTKVYTGNRHVIFQTCISQDGNTSWGRLFVIAEPFQSAVSDGQNN